MSINIHPFFLLPIPPIQLPHPSLCCLQWNSSFLCTQALLNLWPHNTIHNILGIDIPILGNLKKMELNLLGEVFITEDWGQESTIAMKGEFLMMKITVDPGAYISCMVWTLILGLGDHQEASCQVNKSSESMYRLIVPTMAVMQPQNMTSSNLSLDLTMSFTQALWSPSKSG